ncbi:MAG: hypothetical protein HY721_02065, partial [Planctomycetes bacterium]|nr:hypothetical protein [Planctomycetota bacterium]
YWVQGGGEAELLISGPECTGVAVEGGELTFLTSARLPGRGPPGDSLLAFRVSLEAARRHGPLSFPFSTSLLSRIADQVFRGAPDGWPFRSAGEIGECARRGVEVSRELAGRALPVHGRELDRVVGEAFRSRTELTSSGEVLLGVLLAAGFLERGAVWVPSPAAPARGFWQPRIVQTVDSIVAVGYSPADVIASTLHDGEGIWEPVATISRYLKGRKLLLGLDREALAEALAREPVPDLAAAARAGDAAAIGAALRAAPANELLRQRAYLQLSAEGRYDLVAEVAGELARREGAMLVDRKAWLLARTRTAAAGAELAALREDIRKAIEAHPGEASFYLFLGQACEREGGDLKRARACYHRVLKLEAKGDVADQARERLEALEAG